MKRVRWIVVASLAAFAAIAGQVAPGFAASTGAVQVTVYAVNPDKTKELVIGATVVLQDSSKQFPDQALVTNENGQCTFPLVEPGSSYVISVSMPGYTKITKKDIRVVGAVTTQVTVGMIQELSEEVVVKGKERMVELDSEAASQTSISGEEFQDLPVFGRDYQAALTLAPGVQDTNNDGNPNVHGSREQDFRMEVNGVSNVDPLTGSYMSNINPDSIEEIEIVDSGADASFGGAVGGYGRIITKSGSNKFEGAFNVFLADAIFDGRVAGEDPQSYSRKQPSVYFSGPIIRDKLWFSLSHERIMIEDPFTVVGGRSFVQTIDAWRHADKVTWQVTPKNKLQLEWRSDPLEIHPDGVNTLTPPDSGYRAKQGGPTTTFKWIAPFSPTFFWEATVGYSDVGFDANPYNPTFTNQCVLPDPDRNQWAFLSDYYCRDQTVGGRVTGRFPEVYHDKRQRWTYQMDAEQFIDRWLGGQHRLKVGFGMERANFERDDTIEPLLTLRGNGFVGARQSLPDQVPTDSAAYFLDAVSYYYPGQTNLKSDALLKAQRGIDNSTGNYYNLYINDSYEPRSNLSVSVGLRLSREEMTSDGYKFFNPQSERGQYNSVVQQIIEQCVAELGCTPQSQSCYQTCLQRGVYAGEGLFTIHPLDNPDLVITPPPDAPPDWKPGPNDIPQCRFAINYSNCEALDVTRWVSPYVIDGQLNIRNTENFTIVNNSLAPRISVSWDPKNDAKTKISGSWGRYYGETFLGPLVDENGPDRVVQTFALNTYRIPSDTNAGPTPFPLFPSAFSVSMIDRNLKQQRNDEWTIGVEREIAPETAIKLRYVNRHYDDQLQDTDLNHRALTYDEMKYRPPYVYPGIGEDGKNIDCPKARGFYDCTGFYARQINAGTGPGQTAGTEQPDGVPDLVVKNPFFAGVYLIGNFNWSKYEAYIIELTRRYFQNWELNASYTYSKTLGQAEDYSSGLGNDPTIADQEVGPLSFDQPHVVKVNGRVFVPSLGGFRVGGVITYQSGLPYSLTETRPVLDFPTDLTGGEAALLGVTSNTFTQRFQTYRTIYPTAHRNDFRNSGFWDVGVNFQKEFMVKNVKTSFEVEMFNLLNDSTEQIVGVQRILVGYNGPKRLYTDNKVAYRRTGRQLLVALRVNF